MQTHTQMPHSSAPPTAGVALERLAAALIVLGAVGVIATSAFYAASGPEAALPGGAPSVAAARAATVAVTALMRAAGLCGMPSDVFLAVGALLFAATRRGSAAPVAIAGWLAMAVSGVVFIVVDAMVSFVLPSAAVFPDGAATYAAVRSLFDILFAIGTWTFGAGALAAAWSPDRPEVRWPAVLWVMRVAGVAGLAAGSAYMLGLPGSPLLGPGVVLGAVALLLLGASAYRSVQRSTATIVSRAS
jgi:hypothetical protein